MLSSYGMEGAVLKCQECARFDPNSITRPDRQSGRVVFEVLDPNGKIKLNTFRKIVVTRDRFYILCQENSIQRQINLLERSDPVCCFC